jgi:hypothetical protein
MNGGKNPCGLGESSMSVLEVTLADTTFTEKIEGEKALLKATATTMTVDGVIATRLVGKIPAGLLLDGSNEEVAIDEVLVQKNGRTMQLQNTMKGQDAAFAYILSTLKLLASDTSATADWKTYSSAAHGYSLRYPESYVLENGTSSMKLQYGKLDGNATHYVAVTVYTADATDARPAEKIYAWGKGGFKKNAEIEKYHANPRSIKLGTTTFIQTDGDLASTPIPEYFVFKNSKLYQLSTFSTSSSATTNKNLDIVSTFEFVDATADWTTYTNDTYGFSFKYPKSFTYKVGPTSSTTLWSSNVTGAKHEMSVSVLNAKLDPKHVQGIYGEIAAKDITTVKVGDQDGYQYTEGDAGCGGPVIKTALPSNRTLLMSFIQCEGEATNEYATSATSRAEILSTFVIESSTTTRTYTNTQYGFKFSYPRTYTTLAAKAVEQDSFWKRYLYTYSAAAPVDANKTISPVVSLSTSSIVDYALPTFNVNVYPLDQYSMLDKPGATVYGYDVATKKFWKSDGMGAPTSAGIKTLAGTGVTGYLLGTGDMGSLTQMVAFPVVSKNVMVELSFSSVAGLDGDDAKTTKDTTSWKKDIAATFELLK